MNILLLFSIICIYLILEKVTSGLSDSSSNVFELQHKVRFGLNKIVEGEESVERFLSLCHDYFHLGQFYLYSKADGVCSKNERNFKLPSNLINEFSISRKENLEESKLCWDSEVTISKTPPPHCELCATLSFALSRQFFLAAAKLAIVNQTNDTGFLSEAVNLTLHPGFHYSGMLNDLGLLLMHEEDDLLEDALQIFKEALFIDSSLITAILNLSKLKGKIGKHEEEIDLLDNALAKYLANTESYPPLYGATIFHNIGVHKFRFGKYQEAEEAWKHAIEIGGEEKMYLSLGNMASLLCLYGVSQSSTIDTNTLYKKAVSNALLAGDIDSYWSLRFQLADKTPQIYLSTDDIIDLRQKYIGNLTMLAEDFKEWSKNGNGGIINPEGLVGCGALGFYLQYQGFEDFGVRQLYARVTWLLSHKHLTNNHIPEHLRMRMGENSTEPLVTTLATGVNFGTNDSSDIIFMVPNRNDRKIRLGFISAFFRHHSVGLLMKGVIKGLNKELFEKFLIHVTPISKDHVTYELEDAVGSQNVINAQGSLHKKQAAILTLDLDVLIWCEIGMDINTYFLSFSRLAKKSILFWGHPITSGITGINCLHLLESSSSPCKFPAGPDYFLSSRLFEENGALAQQEYSERLILMSGLTTYFDRPKLETDFFHSKNRKRDFLVNIFRNSDFDVMLPDNDDEFILFGIPQTLYKLHPDFDAIIVDILESSPTFYVAFIVGANPKLSDIVRNRLWQVIANRGHSEDNVESRLQNRIIFLPFLSESNFLAFASVLDVALDPFPVGGGRTSLEIFSMGTPIISLIDRTSILHLTSAMIAVMDIKYASSCMATSIADFVHKATYLGLNQTARSLLRKEILSKSFRLYNNESVIEEWEKVIKIIHTLPVPIPTFTSSSNFKANVCKSRDGLTSKYWEANEYCNVTFTHYTPPFEVAQVKLLRNEVNQEFITVPKAFFSNEELEAFSNRQKLNAIQSNQVLYRLESKHVTYGGELKSITIAVHNGEDWREVCLRDAEKSDLDLLKTIFLCSLIGQGVLRKHQSLIAPPMSFVLYPEYANKHTKASTLNFNISLRQGDDLGLVLQQSQASIIQSLSADKEGNMGLMHDKVTSAFIEISKYLFYEFGAKLHTNEATLYRRKIAEDFSNYFLARWTPRHNLESTLRDDKVDQEAQIGVAYEKDGITLAITTCRRLHMFLRTVTSLQRCLGPLPNKEIVRVLIVDDNSSEEDRNTMLKMFPQFDFVFKDVGERGHAISLNIIFEKTITRYVMYIEDDWETFAEPITTSSDQINGKYKNISVECRNTLMRNILEMKEILEGKKDIQQVLFNAQVTRGCSVGDTCDPANLDKGGWLVEGPSSFFLLHEFGIIPFPFSHGDRLFDFSYWPGLSLNPSIMDLVKVKEAVGLCMHRMFGPCTNKSRGRGRECIFSEEMSNFEHLFSLCGFATGLRVGHLPAVFFRHIGGKESAYKLNNQTRPWD